MFDGAVRSKFLAYIGEAIRHDKFGLCPAHKNSGHGISFKSAIGKRKKHL